MAHARKYKIEFKNVQNDIYQVYILEKGYEGFIYELRGATEQVFTTNSLSGDDAVFSAIRAKECTLNFVAEEGIDLLSFYSEDDEKYRIDFYCHEVNGTVIDKLLNSFFLIQDSCEQEFTAKPYDVTLRGTDNIALLKDVAFTTAGMDYHPANGEYLGDIALFDFIKIAIQQIGLADLPLRIYSNIFENTTDDRSDSATAEMFQEIFMNTGKYLNDDGSWQDLYTILEDVLTTFNCCFTQDNGAWNIFRRQESILFTDGKIAGVEHDLTTGAKTAIELNYNWPVAYVPPTFGHTDKIFLDRADHRSRIIRPFKFVKETFNYHTPVLIKHANFELPIGAVPFETNMIGDLREEHYSLSYFPEWVQRNGDGSRVVVVTDTSITPEKEVDRYIYKPAEFDVKCGVQFNPIPVSQNDSFTFTLQFSTFHTDGFFWVRYRLLTFDGEYYSLNLHFPVGDDPYLSWDQAATSDWFSDADGVRAQKVRGTADSWAPYSMFQYLDNTDPILIPKDGILLIEVDGNSSDTEGGFGTYATKWKDIQLTLNQYVNTSLQITGHYHLNEQNLPAGHTIKNNYDQEIQIDDSPRNTIAGTLLTDDTVDLDYTDTDTGEETNVENVHNERTNAWHRHNTIEQRRLGEIIVYERMVNAFKARTQIEGTLYGLRRQNDADEWNFVSLLCLLTIDSLPGYNFIFGVLEIDWMTANYKAVLNELYQDEDAAFDYDYIFQYIYQQNQ